jgi:ubiquinone/menaquinone biosynthesis C-methylase UbiE
MASWYDWFWGDYLNKTFQVPLQLIHKTLAMAMTTTSSSNNDNQITNGRVTVVDVGCGTGEFLVRFVKNNIMKQVFCLGIEPSPEMLQEAKKKTKTMAPSTAETKNIEWIHAAAESLPLEDECANIVCSTNAFHFFRDKPLALQEIFRILKGANKISDGDDEDSVPQPTLIITDWCADYWMVRLYHLMEVLRWNYWNRFPSRYPGPLTSHYLKDLVEQAGFSNVAVQTYCVRVFTFFYWGMQTVTATKEPMK